MKKICFALAIAVIAISAYSFQHYAPAIINWINTLGILAPIFFLLLYCFASILFVPTMALTLAGGALFGPVVGTLVNLFGAIIGATGAFCISRYMIFDWVATKQNVRVRNLIAGVERQGWHFVAILRLMPMVPFSLVNYGLGVTRIKFSHYLIATSVFLIPAEIVFTYCGYAGMDILTHPNALHKSPNFILLICLGVLILLYLGIKRYRRHVSELNNSAQHL